MQKLEEELCKVLVVTGRVSAGRVVYRGTGGSEQEIGEGVGPPGEGSQLGRRRGSQASWAGTRGPGQGRPSEGGGGEAEREGGAGEVRGQGR